MPFREVVFEEGDEVICIGDRGYNFTSGKKYTVLRYEEPVRCESFTFPAYVVVKDDTGNNAHCHATRFEKA